jgi:hypothetical protein
MAKPNGWCGWRSVSVYEKPKPLLPLWFRILKQFYRDMSGLCIVLWVFDICVRNGQCATRACAKRFDIRLAINSMICRETMFEYKRRVFSGMNPPWINCPRVIGLRQHEFIGSWLDFSLILRESSLYQVAVSCFTSLKEVEVMIGSSGKEFSYENHLHNFIKVEDSPFLNVIPKDLYKSLQRAVS